MSTSTITNDLPNPPNILSRARRSEDGDGLPAAFVRELAAWANSVHGLEGQWGTELYTMDIPGFGRQGDDVPRSIDVSRDLHGEAVYALVRGDLTPAKKRTLAVLADRYDMAVAPGLGGYVFVPRGLR